MLTADELGAGRLLLNMVQRDEADRFTMNTLGPLLAGANRSLDDLLVTVRVFFENGRSVRNSARYLSVHENTIRYRLGRVLDLTGLDIATDSDARLTVQVALLIRSPGSPADDPTGDVELHPSEPPGEKLARPPQVRWRERPRPRAAGWP